MILTQGAVTVDQQQQKQLKSYHRKRTVERRDGSAWWRTRWGRIGNTRAGLLPQQKAFLLNNILMFGINISLGHIFTKLYHKEITCTSSTVSTSGPAKGYLCILCTSLGWMDIATDITGSFVVIPIAGMSTLSTIRGRTQVTCSLQ